VTRRNFIIWYLAGLLSATVVAAVAPVLVFIYPLRGSAKKRDLMIKLDRPLSDVQDGEAIKFESPRDTGFVMKDGGGDNAPGKIAFGATSERRRAGPSPCLP